MRSGPNLRTPAHGTVGIFLLQYMGLGLGLVEIFREKAPSLDKSSSTNLKALIGYYSEIERPVSHLLYVVGVV